jgi:hypothetical protein
MYRKSENANVVETDALCLRVRLSGKPALAREVGGFRRSAKRTLARTRTCMGSGEGA